ncbi:MAG: WD40 repeat domain-containing serine/threonine-protein kinase, partial [Planctomycetales bacterium]
MPELSPSRSSSTAENALLAELVARVADHLAQGRQAEVEALLVEHPDQAERIRQLLPAINLLAVTGQSGVAPGSPVQSAFSRAPISFGTLGDFLVVREIGRGGMGVVYEAEQISLSRRVALKVLPFAGMLDPRQLQRFTNEAKAAASLHHQNIVPVYAVGSDRGIHFYAMQLISGQTLSEVVASLRRTRPAAANPRRPLRRSSLDACDDRTGVFANSASESGASPVEAASPSVSDGLGTMPVANMTTLGGHRSREWCRTVARWGAQIADALEYAHSVGVVHRDIKPANLMLDGDGRAWVTDFGLAQLEADAGLTMTGGVVGTLRYMSPEQAAGEKGLVDQRTDVYSLGVTLYELLTLEPAFPVADQKRLLRAVLEESPKPLRQVNPSLPLDLETIVLKALQKEPPQRYATAGALADDLRRFLADRPIAARRPGLAERSVRWCRRHATWVASAVAVCVLAVAGFSASAVLIISERNQAKFERKLREEQEVIARAGEGSMRLNQYVLNIALAAQEFDESHYARARDYLVQCLPQDGEEDLRGVEWHYLWRVTHTLPGSFGKHDSAVSQISVSPDGTLVATGGSDGIRVWDYRTREQVAMLREHAPAIGRPRFSPNGKVLVTTGQSGAALLWDTATWTILREINLPWAVVGADFAPDGKTLFVCELSPDKTDDPLRPDVCRLTVLDTSTWESQGVFDGLPLVRGGAFAPDGATLVLACGGRLRFFDLSTQQAIYRDVDIGVDHDIAYSPVMPILAADSWGRFKIVRFPTDQGVPAETAVDRAGWISSLSFSADGRLLVAFQSRVEVWEFLPEQFDRPFLVATLCHDERVLCARYTPDGRSVITGDANGDLRCWDMQEPVEARRLLDDSRIPIELRFASTSGKLQVTEATTDRRHAYEVALNIRSRERLPSMVLDDSEYWIPRLPMRLKSMSEDAHHRIMDRATGRIQIEIPKEQGFGNPQFSRDGEYVAFGLTSRSVRIWSIGDSKEIVAFAAEAATITALTFSPDNRTLA